MSPPAPAPERAQPAEDRPARFGWRPAIGVNYTDPRRPDYENPAGVWNATAFGPCARCHERCRRYGPGGGPLCDDRKPKPRVVALAATSQERNRTGTATPTDTEPED